MITASKCKARFEIVRVEGGLLVAHRTYWCMYKNDEKRFMEGAIMTYDPFQPSVVTRVRTGNIPIWNFYAKELIP